MSTPAFNFSQLNPYITGMMDRSMRAMDYRLAQLPQQDALNRRAYAEWLNNQASKRSIAEGEYGMRRRGADADAALGLREEKRRVAAAEEAGPGGRMRQYQRLRNLSSIGQRSAWSQPMADQAARAMVWGGARPLTYGSSPGVGERG